MGDISKDINTNFPNNKVKAQINIKYTANWINSKESEFFKDYGLSSQQYNILRILRGSGEKIKVQTVKDRMIERAPNATRLMDKLITKKLIERMRCNFDRRVVYVNITEEGLALLASMDGKIETMDLLGKLTEEESLQLSVLLDKIR